MTWQRCGRGEIPQAGNVLKVGSAVKTATSEAASSAVQIYESGKPTCRVLWPSYSNSDRQMMPARGYVAGKITEVIALANYADESLSRAFGKSGTDERTSSTSGQGTHKLSKTEQERFKNMSPEERAEYWSKQSYEQKQYLCDHYPEMVGNADGVEGWARDRANRINLSEKKLAAEKEVEALKAAVNDPQQASLKQKNQEALTKAEHAVEAYNKIESSLHNGISLEDYQQGKKGDPIGLLTLQDDGRRVKAAVAQGDVDNAKTSALLFPVLGRPLRAVFMTTFVNRGTCVSLQPIKAICP